MTAEAEKLPEPRVYPPDAWKHVTWLSTRRPVDD